MWSGVEHAVKAGELLKEDGVTRVSGITTAMRNKTRPITAKVSLKRRVLYRGNTLAADMPANPGLAMLELGWTCHMIGSPVLALSQPRQARLGRCEWNHLGIDCGGTRAKCAYAI